MAEEEKIKKNMKTKVEGDKDENEDEKREENKRKEGVIGMKTRHISRKQLRKTRKMK